MSDKLRTVRLEIRGYKEGYLDSLLFFDVLNLPDDKTLGCSVNKAIHDKNVDYIKIKVIEKKGDNK